jgi:hypothetical protein
LIDTSSSILDHVAVGIHEQVSRVPVAERLDLIDGDAMFLLGRDVLERSAGRLLLLNDTLNGCWRTAGSGRLSRKGHGCGSERQREHD